MDFNALCSYIGATIEKHVSRALENVSTKQDINMLRSEMDKMFASVTKKIEVMEGEIYDLKRDQEGLTNQIVAMREENVEVKERLFEQECAFKELEQYGRRNNLKIYGLKEKRVGDKGETVEETIDSVCQMCKDKLGVTVRRDDIAIAHRLGEKRAGKERSTIVRFVRRTLRNEVVGARRALKGSSIVVADDLSPFFLALFHELREKAGPRNVWSSGGQLYVKIRGVVKRVDPRDKQDILRQLESPDDGASATESSPSPDAVRGGGRAIRGSRAARGRSARGYQDRPGGDSPPLRGFARGKPLTP